MAKSNKSKWIIGLTGTALSAFVIGQIGGNEPNNRSATDILSTKSLSAEEKEIVELDWTNYTINGVTLTERTGQSDRQTKRS